MSADVPDAGESARLNTSELDDTLSRNERRRLKWFGLYAPRLRLLAYTLYSFYFVMLYTTTTNSMQFARQVLIAVAPGDPDYPGSHQSLMRFIAVAIASVVCLFVYFSRQKSLWANNATAVGKLLLLLAVMAAGGQYLRQNGPKTADWTTTGPATSDGWDWTYGILTVFFSYHGWDNATLVAGEVPRFVRLRTGFVVGVTVVGVMYIILATLVVSNLEPSGVSSLANADSIRDCHSRGIKARRRISCPW